jgi:hypothetical protein
LNHLHLKLLLLWSSNDSSSGTSSNACANQNNTDNAENAIRRTTTSPTILPMQSAGGASGIRSPTLTEAICSGGVATESCRSIGAGWIVSCVTVWFVLACRVRILVIGNINGLSKRVQSNCREKEQSDKEFCHGI